MNDGEWVVLAGGGMTAADWTLQAAPWDRIRSAEGVLAVSAGAVAALFYVNQVPQLPVRPLVRPGDVRRTIVRRVRHLKGHRRWLPGLADPAELVDMLHDVGMKDDWPDWPLQIVVTEIPSKRRVLLDAGSQVSFVWAAAASATIPGMFIPVEFNGKLFVDGGLESTTALGLIPTGVNSLLLVDPRGALPTDVTRRRRQRWETHRAQVDAELEAITPDRFSMVVPTAAEAEQIWSHPLRFSLPGTPPSRNRVSEWMYEQVAVRVGERYRDAADRVLHSRLAD